MAGFRFPVFGLLLFIPFVLLRTAAKFRPPDLWDSVMRRDLGAGTRRQREDEQAVSVQLAGARQGSGVARRLPAWLGFALRQL